VNCWTQLINLIENKHRLPGAWIANNWTTVSSCTSEQGGGSELDASLLGCSGVVGLEFNLACFCTWSRDGDMLSGLNGSDLLLLFLGVCVRNLSNVSTRITCPWVWRRKKIYEFQNRENVIILIVNYYFQPLSYVIWCCGTKSECK
jgi:hypothetical protein